MHQEGRLLKRQPQGAIQVLFHWPMTFSGKLDSRGVQGPIGQQLRVAGKGHKRLVRLELQAIIGKIAIMQIGAAVTKMFKLEQLSTKLRAGSAGAQWKTVLGFTTHSQDSPEPGKNIKLHSSWGPPHFIQARPSTKVKEIQNQDPNIQKTCLCKGPQATLGEIRATTTKTVQRRKGQRKDRGSRLGRSALGSKGTSEAKGKLCA